MNEVNKKIDKLVNESFAIVGDSSSLKSWTPGQKKLSEAISEDDKGKLKAFDSKLLDIKKQFETLMMDSMTLKEIVDRILSGDDSEESGMDLGFGVNELWSAVEDIYKLGPSLKEIEVIAGKIG